MSPPRDLNRQDGWHLDKKVPISLILALCVQFGGGVWYAGRIDARIAQLEADRAQQKERDQRQDSAAELSAQALQSRLDRIDSKLDRLIERRPAP